MYLRLNNFFKKISNTEILSVFLFAKTQTKQIHQINRDT